MAKKPTQEQLTQAAMDSAASVAGGLARYPSDLYQGYMGLFDEEGGYLDIDLPGAEEFGIDTTQQTAIDAVQTAERRQRRSSAAQTIDLILRGANIDPENPITQSMLAGIGDTPQAQLAIIGGPGGDMMLAGFIDTNPDAMLVRVTPYSKVLDENAFTTDLTPLELGSAQAKAAMTGIKPSEMPTHLEQGYEMSETTGAIRYANGTIVTSDNGIIYDPQRSAPGSPGYMRNAANWNEATTDKWKARLVASGYLSKDDAKTAGYTLEFRAALQTYWQNYYINGGKPIDRAKAGGGVEEKQPLIDYHDFQAQITNDMRDQLRRVLATEPSEDQVRAQTQYILRTAADLQKMFRRKEYGSYSSQALTEATERSISNLEESPYHQDILENTKLADSLQNAAYVTRGLMS